MYKNTIQQCNNSVAACHWHFTYLRISPLLCHIRPVAMVYRPCSRWRIRVDIGWSYACCCRPTFRYFSAHTAFLGLLGSLAMCFVVNAVYAIISIAVLVLLVVVLHVRSLETSWGSISQALIFHQVRKYLLLLDSRKNHIKFWRPQVLCCIALTATDDVLWCDGLVALCCKEWDGIENQPYSHPIPMISFPPIPSRFIRPRRRRLEAFTTDSKIIRLISRRVTIFPAAASRQIFDGDCDTANREKIPVVIPPNFRPCRSSINGQKSSP